MSHILLEFVEPHFSKYDQYDDRLRILTLATLAWNISLSSKDDQDKYIENITKKIFPENYTEIKGWLTIMVERKLIYFTEINRFIVEYEYKLVGNNYNLSVASTMDMPDGYKNIF